MTDFGFDGVSSSLAEFVPIFLKYVSVLKQREVPATVSSFYSIHFDAIDVYCCCCSWPLLFCHLECDASVMVVDFAAVETGCMLEKYILLKLSLIHI